MSTMYQLDQRVSVNYVQVKPYGTSSGSLKVYCPSLMPNIGMGVPKVTPVSLNKSAYCNANDCKPTISSKINTQNYLTALAPYHDFDFPCYSFGSTITVHALSEDMLTCRIFPEDEDNSHPWP